jgi:hypothetical protein
LGEDQEQDAVWVEAVEEVEWTVIVPEQAREEIVYVQVVELKLCTK